MPVLWLALAGLLPASCPNIDSPEDCGSDCAAVITQAATACSASGGGTIQLGPGNYILGTNDTHTFSPLIVLSNLENVTLQG